MLNVLPGRTLSLDRRVIFGLVMVVALAGLALACSAATVAPTCSWNVVSSPNSQMPFNILRGVAVVMANDVWAVGNATSNEEEPGEPLIEHWDGAAWTIISSPPLAGAAALNGVAENSSTDVWAVGEVGSQTLTEHWNGKQWQVIPSPSKAIVNGQPANDVLTSVVALAPDNVWAAGYAATEIDVSETLTLHWDGVSWTIVPSPNPGGYFGIRLSGVTAVGTNDIWAAGQAEPGGQTFNMIQHWDGTNWSIVPSAHFSGGDSATAISALTAGDIWAVGMFFIPNAEGSATQTATWHWNGTTWSMVPSPSPSQYFALLNGVVALKSGDVWAVGTSQEVNDNPLAPLILRWSGANWNVFPSPPVPDSAELLGVAAVSPTELWSVGGQAYFAQTLIEHFTCK